MEDFIAYKGEAFQIEFYFDARKESQPMAYTEALPEADIRKFMYLLRMMGDIGQIRNKEKFNYEGDGIYAFKPQPHRFLCFFVEGKKIIITNAFTKKTQKLPVNEKERAIQCKDDFESRNKNGKYYESGK